MDNNRAKRESMSLEGLEIFNMREIAQQMANHGSVRTTGLYDRWTDQLSLDEVERIVIYRRVSPKAAIIAET